MIREGSLLRCISTLIKTSSWGGSATSHIIKEFDTKAEAMELLDWIFDLMNAV